MSQPYGLTPPLATNQQQSSTHQGGSSSVGPVIGVLAVIVVLGLISAMIGRLCAGRRIPGLGQYDFEGWFERKFAPCIDGRDEPPLPQRVTHANGATATGDGGGCAVPIVIPMEASQEMKQSDAAAAGHES